jgi:hypothetical protein
MQRFCAEEVPPLKGFLAGMVLFIIHMSPLMGLVCDKLLKVYEVPGIKQDTEVKLLRK